MTNPFLEERKRRMEQSKKIIESINGSKYEKVLATLTINLGIKRKTAIEYVRDLIDFEFIEKHDSKIYVINTHTHS